MRPSGPRALYPFAGSSVRSAAAAFVLSAVFAASAPAGPVGFSADGVTGGLIVPVHGFGRDFDGEKLVLGEDGDLLMLPRADSGAGAGLNIGMLFNLPGIYTDLAVDFTFARTDHPYTWGEHSGTMRNHFTSVAASFAGPLHWRIQPFVTFGWGSFALRLNHGLLDPGGEAEVAWFYGESVTLGLGANFYLSRFWKIWVQCGNQSRSLTKYARSLPGVRYGFAGDAAPKAGGRIVTFGVTRTISRPFTKQQKAPAPPESPPQEPAPAAPSEDNP